MVSADDPGLRSRDHSAIGKKPLPLHGPGSGELAFQTAWQPNCGALLARSSAKSPGDVEVVPQFRDQFLRNTVARSLFPCRENQHPVAVEVEALDPQLPRVR